MDNFLNGMMKPISEQFRDLDRLNSMDRKKVKKCKCGEILDHPNEKETGLCFYCFEEEAERLYDEGRHPDDIGKKVKEGEDFEKNS